MAGLVLACPAIYTLLAASSARKTWSAAARFGGGIDAPQACASNGGNRFFAQPVARS
jgi:hypothetical protein